MIPKVAHFVWCGPGEPSPLRAASMATFKHFNPTWDVRWHDDRRETFRQAILHSDSMRYDIMGLWGGFYFDTDIIFRRPMPEAWLKHQNGIVLHEGGMARGVAILAAEPPSRFFAEISRGASERLASRIECNFQSLGTKLLHTLGDLRAFADRWGETLWNIPQEAFFPIDWHSVELLWSPGYPDKLGDEVIGVHWFGGDRLSQEFEAMPLLPDCLVRNVVDALVSKS